MFHAWKTFHFDENAETIYTYVQMIRQVVTMLNYGELQILGVFKNTLPSCPYWVLFPIDSLRQAVEMIETIVDRDYREIYSRNRRDI